MKWLVTIPAWGDRCIKGLQIAVAAARCSADRCGSQLRFIVHTDDAWRVGLVMKGLETEILPVPPGSEPHGKLGNAHRQAIRHVRNGECIAFINADMVCSQELFGVAEKYFTAGKRLIMMTGTRTIGGIPAVGMNSAELLRWAVSNQHPSTTECFFGRGRSTTTSMLYFRRGEDIVLRAFHLHPFAILLDRPIVFSGVTIDADLADNYEQSEIHIITSADEASFAEMSPPERVFRLSQTPMDVNTVLNWAVKGVTSPLHLWFFEHPIAIVGDGKDVGDGVVCDLILSRLKARVVDRVL